jgi:hypothetical protein
LSFDVERLRSEFVSHRLIFYLVSFYAGYFFGWWAVVLVRDNFLVYRTLIFPTLGGVNDDGHIIDDWYRKYRRAFSTDGYNVDEWYRRYRRDFMPDFSGRIFEDSKSIPRSVDSPVRNFEYVGHGGVTNNSCGQFLGWVGCLQHPKHKNGLIWAYKVFKSCDSPRCSLCARFGWASRLASSVEARLVAASKVLGDIEHAVCSFPKKDYYLSYKQMKNGCIQILKSCSFLGGFMIFHAKSFGKYRPHFHVLGVIGAVGGAERCRHCKGADCYQCDGIEGRCYRAYADTGYIIRVFDKRKTIRGTISYEADHCTIDYSKRRFRVSTWWGCMAYANLSRLGIKVEKSHLRCPECGSDCGPIEYFGSRKFNLERDSRGFVAASFEPPAEDGKIVWQVRESFNPSEEDE